MSEETYDTDPLIRTLVEQLAQAQGLPLFRQKSYRLIEAFARQREAAALDDAAEGLTRRFLGWNDKLPHDVAECVAILQARAQQRRDATEQGGGGGGGGTGGAGSADGGGGGGGNSGSGDVTPAP